MSHPLEQALNKALSIRLNLQISLSSLLLQHAENVLVDFHLISPLA